MIDFELGFIELSGTDNDGKTKFLSDYCTKFYDAVKKKNVSLSQKRINTTKIVYL